MAERRINLEIFDFDIPEKNKKEEEIDIEKIKIYYESLIEKISKKQFEEGYKKGFEDASKKTEETLKKSIQEKELQLKQEILQQKENIKKENESRYQKLVENINSEIDRFKNNYRKYLEDIVLENLGEILNILYIKGENVEFIKQKILQIIEEFEKENVIKVIVNKDIAKNFKNFPYPIEEGNVEKGDFIIKFDKFQIENNFKEKIESIKNEIKREIKETT